MQFYEQALRRYDQASEQQKNYFDIAATLVLIIILLIMIFPAIDHILKLNQEIQAGQVVKTALEKKMSDLDLAESNLNKIKDKLYLAQLALPTGSNLTDYLKSPIESFGSAHNLSIKNVQFSSVPLTDPTSPANLQVKDMKYSVTFQGNYLDFTSFLKDLEGFIRTSSVDSVDIKSEQGVSINLTAQTNYMGLSGLLNPATSTTTTGASQ